jgi:hypothetical protein
VNRPVASRHTVDLASVLVGGGDHLELHERGVITDATATAVVAADATIEWWCSEPAGAALFSRLIDDRGAALRFGPVPGAGQPASNHVLSAGTQRRIGLGVVTTLWAGEALVEIHDSITDGIITRLLTVLRGPVTIGWSWAPGPTSAGAAPAATRRLRWTEGMSVGRTVVRGMAEGVGTIGCTGDRFVLSISTVGIDGLPIRTRADVELNPDRVTAANHRQALELARSVDQLAYGGPWRRQVLNAATMLRGATSSSGGVVRAATTSLPRGRDNERNIDERFVWLDDTARAVRLWERLGRHDWADTSRQWLAVALLELDEVPAPVRTAEGAAPPGESDPGLSGWRLHHPARFGTAVANHIDLGAVALASLVLDPRQHRRQIQTAGTWLVNHVNNGVPSVDHGRWGARSKPQRHIASALGTQLALQAASVTLRHGDPLNADGWEFHAAGVALSRWLDSEGCAGSGGDRTWRRTPADDTLDAMLLRWIASPDPARLPVGLASDAERDAIIRMRRTVDRAGAQLGEMAMLHRHLPHVDDGFPPGQAADLGASFEFVAALARAEQWDEAHERWDALLGMCDPWLQLPGAVDPIRGLTAGNLADTPAALALIEAAISLEDGPT